MHQGQGHHIASHVLSLARRQAGLRASRLWKLLSICPTVLSWPGWGSHFRATSLPRVVAGSRSSCFHSGRGAGGGTMGRKPPLGAVCRPPLSSPCRCPSVTPGDVGTPGKALGGKWFGAEYPLEYPFTPRLPREKPGSPAFPGAAPGSAHPMKASAPVGRGAALE